MHRWTRSWITTVVAWIAVLFIGGAAIAGVGAHSANSSKSKAPEIQASDSESPEASESPDPEESGDGEKADNHGQCVSTWAHKAKEGDNPLTGKFFGGFVSTVAQSDDTGADCDESAVLAEWAAKQDAASSESATSEHGKSGEHKAQGKSHEEGSGDEESETESSGS